MRKLSLLFTLIISTTATAQLRKYAGTYYGEVFHDSIRIQVEMAFEEDSTFSIHMTHRFITDDCSPDTGNLEIRGRWRVDHRIIHFEIEEGTDNSFVFYTPKKYRERRANFMHMIGYRRIMRFSRSRGTYAIWFGIDFDCSGNYWNWNAVYRVKL